jgi:hypothetical protein
MADNTILNLGTGGDTLRTEDVGGGVKVPVSKIHTGASDVDGGPVTTANPFPVQVVSGSQTSLLQGGVLAGPANPISTQTVSGSLVSLLQGGLAVSAGNAVPVQVENPVSITANGSTVSWTAQLPVIEPCGQVVSGSTVSTVNYAFGDFSTSGSANQLVGQQGTGAGKRIRVLSAVLSSANAVNVRFTTANPNGSTGSISGQFFVAASGGFVLPFNPHGWFQTNVSESLNVATTGGTDVGIGITWVLAGQ